MQTLVNRHEDVFGACELVHLSGSVGAGQRHDGPECNAATHDVLPVVPIAQVSKEGGQKHVAADENYKKTENGY